MIIKKIVRRQKKISNLYKKEIIRDKTLIVSFFVAWGLDLGSEWGNSFFFGYFWGFKGYFNISLEMGDFRN